MDNKSCQKLKIFLVKKPLEIIFYYFCGFFLSTKNNIFYYF
jgi:hypothetical protein